MTPFNDISPQILVILGITLTVIFVIMVLRICCDINVLHKSRKQQKARIKGLLLSNMLGRLNIPLKKYDRKTSDLDKERHIWLCEHCAKPEECERILLGEDINPRGFCPNFEELEKIMGKLKASKMKTT